MLNLSIRTVVTATLGCFALLLVIVAGLGYGGPGWAIRHSPTGHGQRPGSTCCVRPMACA
ncbi:hypothetical protein ACFS3C_14280 [Azotobacter vinelandii]